ncbi:hypothetical protein TIFTF001_020972 [Ficus carica]|uniref:Uncharacterized protein n=1 Tax=Ficus carica TaxID=3494 RepID=A0AA88DD62_FICCA|nr:hypothetical protein TIFTF001_020972 [Ficus carica]
MEATCFDDVLLRPSWKDCASTTVFRDCRGSYGFHDGFQKPCSALCFCLTFHDRFLKTVVKTLSWNPNSVLVHNNHTQENSTKKKRKVKLKRNSKVFTPPPRETFSLIGLQGVGRRYKEHPWTLFEIPLVLSFMANDSVPE